MNKAVKKKAGTLCILLLIIINLQTLVVKAQEKTSPPKESPQNASSECSPIIKDHSIKLNGQKIDYRTITGYLNINEQEKKKNANVFFMAYEKMDKKSKDTRPITFVFNGGPRAASVFLHLCALGPKRVLWKNGGSIVTPPYQLIPNENTWLPFTDLVFIDPVGTGYSFTSPDLAPEGSYGVKEDIKIMAEFIQLYLIKYDRWLSPKFIAGESYGSTRAAGLSAYLQDTLYINLNGLIFISPVLDFHTIEFQPGNDLPYCLSLPTLTATAWYHDKLQERPEDITTLLQKAQSWAIEEYYLALVKGASLPIDKRKEILEKLAFYTGLPMDLLEKKNLRITPYDFTARLLQKEQRIIGLLDGRIISTDPDPTNENSEFDPSLFIVTGPLKATISTYLKKELNFSSDRPYQVLNREVNKKWKWTSGIKGRQGYVNKAVALKEAIMKNNTLKVFFACGYYDLTTPYFSSNYTIEHLGIDHSLRDNITISYYPAGHQIYLHLPSLQKLTNDMVMFYKTTLAISN